MAGAGAVLLLLVCAAAVVQPAAAKRSPECRGGCIIASVLHPRRVCKCVVPQCSVPGAEQTLASGTAVMRASAAAAAAAAGFPRGKRHPRSLMPPRLDGVDCDFCDRGFNTYARLVMGFSIYRVVRLWATLWRDARLA
jgi:hypothetical protein